MSDELPVGDKTYVSSKRAAEISGYAQDYIGQLARSGQIEASRMGGLWYVHMESLDSYKSKPTEVKVEDLPKDIKPSDKDSDVLVSFDGRDYISAHRAAKITGYNQDYIGQLARGGKILSRQVGNRWYIDRDGIQEHKKEKDGLLAAVQAASVGIYRQAPDVRAEEVMEPRPDDKKLLSYNTEIVDLQPRLPEKSTENMVKPDIVPEIEPEQSEIDQPVAVPILIKRPVSRVALTQTYRQPVRHVQHVRQTPRKMPFAVGLSVFTVVIVLAIGIVGLTKVSTFATAGAATSARMTANALSAAASDTTGGLMDAFEQLVSPELTYQRQDQ